ncbi:MAG TPA: prolipoprotein diacylglyceryl transferase [Mycobacterium sp.]|nr:prolipoprotein diacylglyceryl transferase [Mycobacterium sp.]
MTTTVLAYIPSPPQGVWHLGVIPIRAYALFIIVGIVAALIIGDRRWEARGGQPGVIYDIALWAVPFGLVGGRLYHVMTDWWRYFGSAGAGFGAVFKIWDGGLGIWGAVALGGVGAWIGCRHHRIPLPAFGDAIAPGIILAQAIGRIGNYFNQELFGRDTTLPWALEIYERKNAAGVPDNLNGVSTGEVLHLAHPTFLYELLWNLLIFAALIWIDRRYKIGHGRLFAIYVAGYCIGRFWIELLRVDDATEIDGIRINSFTSMLVFIGAVVYVILAPKGREDPATLRGRPKADEEEDTAVEEFVKELTAVGATTGVVAAAKAAGEAEDEDAKAATEAKEFDKAEEPETVEAESEEPAAEAEEAAEPTEPEAKEAEEPVDEAQPEAETVEAESEEPAAEAEEAAEPTEPEAEEAEEPAAETDESEEAVPEPEAEVAEEAQAEPQDAVEPDAEVEDDTGSDEDAEKPQEAEPEPLDAEEPAAEEAETDAEDAEPEATTAEPAAAEATPGHQPEESGGGRVRRWLRRRSATYERPPF